MSHGRWSAEDLELAREASLARHDLEVMKPLAVEAFEAKIAGYPDGVSIEQVYADAEAIEGRYARGVAFSGIAPLIFRYCGRNVLTKVIPDLETTLIRIDGEMQGVTMDSDDLLSDSVNDVPAATIVQSIAQTSLASYHANPRLTRAERSDGICGVVSSKVVARLGQDLPDLAPTLRLITLPERASRPIRQVQNLTPRVRGLGMEHNILALDDSHRMIVFDPTIAQVDQPEYDIEANVLSTKSLTNFVQLRYGMLPPDMPKIYTPSGSAI
jgi:hypothetical protein